MALPTQQQTVDTIDKRSAVDNNIPLNDNHTHDDSIEKGTVVTVADEHGDEPEKAYYSKQSVWLMILFSGLAIGSDGL